MLRVVAHLLLDQVRSEGMPELVRTLVEVRDAYEYAARPRVLPEPSTRSITTGSVERRTVPRFDIELE